MEKLIKENENLEKIITDQGEKIIELKNYIETLKEVICQQGIIIENFRNYKEELNQGKIEQRKIEVRKLKETEKEIRNGMDIEKVQEQMQIGNVRIELQENQMENIRTGNDNRRKRGNSDSEGNESIKRRKVTKKGKVKELIKELEENEQIIEMLECEEQENSLTGIYRELVEEEMKMKESCKAVIRIYYKFGKKIEERFNYYKERGGELEANKWVNEEIRQGFGGEILQENLRKRKERARKIYDLFKEIGYWKIENIQKFSIWEIGKLTWKEIEYVKEQIMN
jgi:hypothetical protein